MDEEKQDEKANEEGQADDQINGMLKSPLDDEKDNLDPEKESETSSQKVPDADDNVKDEGDGCSESELEEDKQGKLFSLSYDLGSLKSMHTTFLFLIFSEIVFKGMFRAWFHNQRLLIKLLEIPKLWSHSLVLPLSLVC